MSKQNNIPKVGEVVQITHGGLSEWLTIEVLSPPFKSRDAGGGRCILVRYPVPVNSGMLVVDRERVGIQYNIDNSDFQPVTHELKPGEVWRVMAGLVTVDRVGRLVWLNDKHVCKVSDYTSETFPHDQIEEKLADSLAEYYASL